MQSDYLLRFLIVFKIPINSSKSASSIDRIKSMALFCTLVRLSLSADELFSLSLHPIRELPNIDVVAPIPKDCFLDDAGLPHTKGAKDLYTVYQSQSGCYHSERCYHAHSGTPKNITEIQFGSPCAKCHPVFDLSWYTRRVQAEKKIQILSDVLSYNASPPKRAENMTAQVPLHPQMVVEAKQKPRQAEQPAQTSNDTSKSSGRQEFTIAIRVQIIFMLIVLLFAYLFGQR